MYFSDLVDWGLKIVAAWMVLFLIQIPLRRGSHPIARTVIFVIKVLLIPVAALFFVAIEWKYGYTLGDVVAAIYLALIGDVAASVVEYLIRRVAHIKDRSAGKGPCLWKLQCILSFLLCVGVTWYGVTNAWSVEKRTHTWQAEGLTQAHTFAFLSDVHAGSAQSLDVLEDVCRQINLAMPEFVILGGDITDELTSKEEMAAAYQVFSKIEAPVYFVYGNHDRQPNGAMVGKRTYTDAELDAALETAGIRVLKDEYVRVADDLVLLGREDMSRRERKPWAELVNPEDEGTYALVVADHSPYDKEQLKEEVSALQLSGHTHAGQVWPLQIVYRLLGLPAYGEFKEKGTTLLVSAGESGWMVPLRTEAHCEWHLITLKPAG
jgi:predicted MPP superfamily phosphohydrolase